MLVAATISLSLVNNFSWLAAGLMFSSLAGLAIAVLIVQHELGISNELIGQLCNAGRNTDCDAVLQSKGSRLVKWLNWADAGIIYFTSYTLLIVIIQLAGNNTGFTVPAILSAAAVPFTLFSLYYQWRVVKKWCTLCLLTVAVLWVQFALTVTTGMHLVKEGHSNTLSLNQLLLPVMIFTITCAVWMLVLRPALKNNKDLISKNYSLLRIKNNLVVFESLLKRQRRVDTSPFENELQLGNPHARVQIMVACNPYCGPCALAHKVLHEITETNDIGLTIRLSIKADNPEDKRTIAGKYIMELVSGTNPDYKRKILHDWYEWMDLEKFKEKYPLQNRAHVQWQLGLHEKWITEAKIEFTPTIFINGYQLPKQYKPEDLKNLLGRVNNNRTESEEPVTENNLALA